MLVSAMVELFDGAVAVVIRREAHQQIAVRSRAAATSAAAERRRMPVPTGVVKLMNWLVACVVALYFTIW